MSKSLLASLTAALVACLLACVVAPAALAQNNICPTAPNGDSTNKCASTAFVQNALAGGTPLPLPNAEIYIGDITGHAAARAMSGDCTISNTGAISCPIGGDLSGTLGNATVAKVQGLPWKAGATYANGQQPIWVTANGDFEPGSPPASIQLPGGRLTLISGQPEMKTDAVGAQNVYYAPDVGSVVSIYNGTTIQSYQFTSSATDQVGLTLALGGSANWPSNTIYDVFVVLNGGVPVLATRAWDSSMLPAAPAQVADNTTITTGTGAISWTNPTNAFNGTPAQNTAASANMTSSNNSVQNCLGQDFGAGNAVAVNQIILTAPTDNNVRSDALSALEVYAWASSDNTNWTLADERFINDSAIGVAHTIGINNSLTIPYRYWRMCFPGAGGTTNLHVAQIQFYTVAGPSTRRLTKYNGMLVNDATITTARISSSSTISVPQYQATYLGSVQTDSGTAGQVSAYVTPGPSRVYNIWNAYNTRTITVQAVVPGTVTTPGNTSYVLTSPILAFIQGTSTFSVTALVGYAYEPLSVSLVRTAYFDTTSQGAGYQAGIALDNINRISGVAWNTTVDSTGIQKGEQGTASLTLQPFFGSHTFFGVESKAYTSTGVLSLFPGILNTVMSASWKG